MSIIVITLPITLPLVVAAGYDPIWFGVFLVIVAELAVLTPPVGFNLFVVQSLTGYDLPRVARATMPFFLTMVLSAVISLGLGLYILFRLPAASAVALGVLLAVELIVVGTAMLMAGLAVRRVGRP